MKVKSLISAIALLALMSHAIAGGVPVKKTGGILVGKNGMTLYTFDKDTTGSGKSVCNDQCAINWPPLMASKDAKSKGNYNIIMRDDGTKQWAYKGQPLYYWIKDKKPGDKTGDGVQGVWHIVKPY